MDRRLLEAAKSGDATEMKQLAVDKPGVLVGTTPQGNTCLHVASIHGHEGFCKDVLSSDQSVSLLTAINKDGETPLLTAVTRGHDTLASVLLRYFPDQLLGKTILKQDKHGCNVLHHAIRRGYKTLALELIDAEPALSKAANKRDESPMFIAAMRNFEDLLDKLLRIPDSAHSGPFGFNVLHAAVRKGNKVIAKRVMETRPWLVSQETENKYTPMHLAAYEGKIEVLTVFLEHDLSLGYLISTAGKPLLCTAASKGHVGVARELLKHCPDAPYCDEKGSTCLHQAVLSHQEEFVEFVLSSRELHHLLNLADINGETALHLAVRNGKTKISRALSRHQGVDGTMLDIDNSGECVKAFITDEDDTICDILLSEVGTNWSDDPLEATVDEIAFRPHVMMDGQLLEAAARCHVAQMMHLYQQVPDVLLGTTPQWNTCLHVAAIHGHKVFCEKVLTLNPSLLAAVNLDGENPLLAALASGRDSVASVLLGCWREHRPISGPILVQDNRGNNALHHAIRSGHKELALELIAEEPALSEAVNIYDESPMFIAVMRNYDDVFEKLCDIPDSAHGGPNGVNALHAAVRNGNSAIVKKIMEQRPALAEQEDKRNSNTPLQLTVVWNMINVLRVFLEHNPKLGYVTKKNNGSPLLNSAAFRGHVGVARELLKHCPDAPFTRPNGSTCLHRAVGAGHLEFVNFVLGLPQSGRLINLRNKDGDTALHLAIQKCNPKMVAALLHHPCIDVTVLDKGGDSAIWKLQAVNDHSKTLNWNEISMLMLKADPQAATNIYNLRKDAHDKLTESSREDIKSLTQTYTGNTSLVAILIATVTFAAAFTLPGGYGADAGNEGLPIMARKFAFKAFLVSDTLAMCSSLVVAFACIIAKREDLEFLLHYRSFTKKLMWFAYMATTTAFATGLYTVLAPRLLWLAVLVCVLTTLLPILTKLLGEWPILKLRFRLGKTFKSDLLDMI